MESTQSKVEQEIKTQGKGKIFFADDFATLGTPESIRQSLNRLEDDGLLLRIAHGIYTLPKMDPILGVIMPDLQEVAEAIARRDRARIIASGQLALYLLGLSLQIPLKYVYLTDGASRNITVGNQIIQFKRTVPKTFAIKNRHLQLLVQAIKAKKKDNIDESFLDHIAEHLKRMDKEVVIREIRYAPVWIQKIITSII